MTKFGHFTRISDKRRFQRFKCHLCSFVFSDVSFHRCYRQKKRRLNGQILRHLSSKVSQRRVAELLGIHRTTVARRLIFLGAQYRLKNAFIRSRFHLVSKMQFDDLETFEHTKCKPLSVTMAVEEGTRYILGFRVSVMPAKGYLASLSRKKYGPRPDGRKKAREELFEEIRPLIDPCATILSDQSPHYPLSVKKYFPKATHKTCKGKRGCVTGQGELKKTGFDPLFSLNHTFAMLRDNINRLVRKTWCTTKDIERLKDHIEIYVYYHNKKLMGL